MTRPEKKCLMFCFATSAVVLGIVLAFSCLLVRLYMGRINLPIIDFLFSVGIAICILGVMWGIRLDKQMTFLAWEWKRLGLGPIKTFPDTDYLRMAWLVWARAKLKELAKEYTSAETAYFNARARVNEWHMPKPMTVVNAVGFEVAREEEKKELARMNELKKCRDDAEKALRGIMQKYRAAWRLFEQMTIGKDTNMPKNMLPVHSDGSHWAHADAYRKHVAKGSPSSESPQEARVDQEGGDDLPI